MAECFNLEFAVCFRHKCHTYLNSLISAAVLAKERDSCFLDEAVRVLTLTSFHLYKNPNKHTTLFLSLLCCQLISYSSQYLCSPRSPCANTARHKILSSFWCYYNARTPLWFSDTQLACLMHSIYIWLPISILRFQLVILLFCFSGYWFRKFSFFGNVFWGLLFFLGTLISSCVCQVIDRQQSVM